MFKFSECGFSFKIEVIGGVIIFLIMVYIVFVNLVILFEVGMDKVVFIIVIILVIVIGIFIFVILGNVLFVLVFGMGLNVFFIYFLVIGVGILW